MADLAAPSDPAPATRPRRWWAALLLSLVAPGVGQVYNGQAGKGLAFLAVTLVGAQLATILSLQPIPWTVFLATFGVAWLARLGAIAEGTATAWRLRFGYRPRRYNRGYVYLAAIALTWCLFLVASGGMRTFVRSFKIPSASTEPTILRGDSLFVDTARFRHAPPRRGDLVIYRSTEDPRVQVLKRVVGVGGDRVEIRNKALFVDGMAVPEPYAVHRDPRIYARDPTVSPTVSARDNFGPYVVPAGQLFVLGDNRDNSWDSRFFGPVPVSSVAGGGRIRVYWSRDPETGTVRWDRSGRFVR